jgi:hypothetical protein
VISLGSSKSMAPLQMLYFVKIVFYSAIRPYG